ncbi:DUF4288 domain-containing protein [Cryptosporangium minutisporangium]|uniref:DUF4288 domain-containing protein n=1 Tax=Cryptosporangium minutisporangium TaxID=113569 RepID=A0ABP6SSC6_9ACTN
MGTDAWETETGETAPYIALLLFASSSDSADYRPLYSEDIVLLHARSVAHATQKARQLGEDRKTAFRNDRGELITWSFLRLADVAPALYGRLDEDVELYSRHFADLEAYERFDGSATETRS